VTVPDPLPEEDVEARLAVLDGWSGGTAMIAKTFRIEYHAGIRMVVDVAKDAKEHMHHPDIDVRWDEVRFGLTTHDADHRVTVLDFESAERIDRIAAEHGAVATP
jgi:4a-hydroxytetrahydrobiopterin dehydratase